MCVCAPVCLPSRRACVGVPPFVCAHVCPFDCVLIVCFHHFVCVLLCVCVLRCVAVHPVHKRMTNAKYGGEDASAPLKPDTKSIASYFGQGRAAPVSAGVTLPAPVSGDAVRSCDPVKAAGGADSVHDVKGSLKREAASISPEVIALDSDDSDDDRVECVSEADSVPRAKRAK